MRRLSLAEILTNTTINVLDQKSQLFKLKGGRNNNNNGNEGTEAGGSGPKPPPPPPEPDIEL